MWIRGRIIAQREMHGKGKRGIMSVQHSTAHMVNYSRLEMIDIQAFRWK